MTDPAQIARLAEGLSEGSRRGLTLLPAWGFPAGHNAWPDMQYDDGDPDDPACEGEDMDALLRAGLVEAIDEQDGPLPECCFEMADAVWTLRLTPDGQIALAHLTTAAQEKKDG